MTSRTVLKKNTFSYSALLVFQQRHGAYVSQPISREKAEHLLRNPNQWRVDTLIKEPPAKSVGTTSTGILPGMAETTYRKTDLPNSKRR